MERRFFARGNRGTYSGKIERSMFFHDSTVKRKFDLYRGVVRFTDMAISVGIVLPPTNLDKQKEVCRIMERLASLKGETQARIFAIPSVECR
jgi:hypothetical protein